VLRRPLRVNLFSSSSYFSSRRIIRALLGRRSCAYSDWWSNSKSGVNLSGSRFKLYT
jgi:hypothetical protein